MAVRTIRVKVGERWYTVEVEDFSTSPVQVTVDGETFYVEVEDLQSTQRAVWQPARPRAPRPGPPQARRTVPHLSEKLIRSPMPGKIMAVNVRPGDTVSAGQEVCVVEAMKMEQSVRTPQAGVIKAVHIQPLQQVGTEDPLVELE